ncbi:PAS domain S-box protein [Roseateles violae]|uniref:histidine kinase n=1 Tax=Roseateles violae TaxID=3058042 RepID=A0ABT8DQB7_9BURK|nr:PAS domain S-box protein [Pelomonas sp. PFR6]MDN3920362.1 PAS domain S-box protein [Pelomonas sp. PFR6]
MPAPTPSPATAGLDEQAIFRSLHAAYPDALLVVDAAGAIVLANQAAEALLGYTGLELVGMSVDQLLPDAIRSRHAAYRKSYDAAPRARPMGTQSDLVARRKDGSEVMVEIALSPLQGHGLPLVVAAIRDIGAYPRVRQALRRARYAELLALVGRDAVDSRDPQVLLQRAPAIAVEALEAAAASVWLLRDGRQQLRPAASAGDLPGIDGVASADRAAAFAGQVLAEGHPIVVADLDEAQRFDIPAAYRAAGLRSGLGVPVFDRGRPIGAIWAFATTPGRFGEDETRFLQSLSNLLASSLQRAQSEEALNHSQRLESVGQLTGGIAHDFNNLLTVIQGNLQVLEETPGHADPQSQALLAAALRAARRGAELTGKLLAFSRRQVLNPSEVDAGALLESLADLLRRTLDQRIAIEVHAEGRFALRADAGQLESALLNIAINARDAMPEGGRLRFSAEVLPALPEALRGELDQDAAAEVPFVAISVADSGTGMSDAVKERAFEPFFTTKDSGRGTGLGLSTVYGFARQSKGSVALSSAPGQGTTVTLYIPSARGAGVAATPREEAAAAAAIPAGLSVLLVEDDAEVRAVVCAYLDALQCRTTAFRSAEEALPALGPEARFDLLLSDISLGAGMRGTEFAAIVQQRLPAIAVLLMSGFSADLLDADRAAPPSWELLPKPYGRDELRGAIARALALRPQ